MTRRTLLITSYLILTILSCMSYATEGPVSDANKQLRTMFSQLDHYTNFLYDRSAHIIDEAYFSVNCSLEANSSIWYFAYQEMYNSAKDQTKLIMPEVIVDIAYNYESDTIPIGVMSYVFNRLKTGVLDSHDYFEFDTIAGVLTRRNYVNFWEQTFPYEEGAIFMVAPLVASTHTKSPVFCIDDNLLFIDDDVLSLLIDDHYSLYVNFGDGYGEHKVSIGTSNYIHAYYSSPGNMKW